MRTTTVYQRVGAHPHLRLRSIRGSTLSADGRGVLQRHHRLLKEELKRVGGEEGGQQWRRGGDKKGKGERQMERKGEGRRTVTVTGAGTENGNGARIRE